VRSPHLSKRPRPAGVLLAPLLLLLLGCSASVVQGLDEPAANEAMAVLERDGIAVEKAQEEGTADRPTFRLRVPRGDATRALAVLQALDLPRPPRQGLAETYAHPSLVPSAEEEEARFLAAKENDLAATLEAADGVARARVHLVGAASAGAPTLVGSSPPRGRAAVFLKTLPSKAALSPAQVQRLVAGAVQGLEPEDVTVVVAPAAGAVPADVWSAVGPIRVSPSSRSLLLAIFAAGLGVIAALAGALLWLLRRRPGGYSTENR